MLTNSVQLSLLFCLLGFGKWEQRRVYRITWKAFLYGGRPPCSYLLCPSRNQSFTVSFNLLFKTWILVIGAPIQFYLSSHLRVGNILLLLVYQLMYLQCLFIFDVFMNLLTQQKVRNLIEGKNNNHKKRMVTRLVENIAAETPLRHHTPNPEATAHYRSKTTLSWTDGWVSRHRGRKWGWLWDKLGLLSVLTQRQLLSLLYPAGSRGRSRQEAKLAHSYKRVRYGRRAAGGEREKWMSGK